jgi:hypothetical protein
MKTLTESPKAKPSARGTAVVPVGRDELNRAPGSYPPEVIAIKNLRVEFASREGFNAWPDHLALLFELGRIYLENNQDLARTRSVWQHTAKSWHKLAGAKPEPDTFILEQIQTHLAKLEEDARTPSLAIRYWEQARDHFPAPDAIQERIVELRQKQAAANGLK